jgi:hypothetical protein
MLRLPELCLTTDITALTAGDLTSRNIGLLTVDIENLVTDFGSTEVRTDVQEHLASLCSGMVELDIALITNNASPGFAREVSEQLGSVPYYYPDGKLRDKMRHDMFAAAASDLLFSRVNHEPLEQRLYAAHIDDQLKNYVGMAMPHGRDYWRTYFWPVPYGEHQHPGARAFRPFENVLRAITTK